MYEILIAVYVIIALALIGLVLIQQGKGSDMGASFGAGASATLFGSNGSGNFLTKTTAILATLFFVISIFLGSLTANSSKVVDDLETAPVETTLPTDMPMTESSDSDIPASTPSTTESDVPVGE